MINRVQEGKHDLYIMDVNLSYSNSFNFSCAFKVQELVDSRVPVITCSYDGGIIDLAKSRGFDAVEKKDLVRRLDELSD